MPNAPRTVVFKEPQWRNGQRIRLLIWGLRVRVPPGVAFFTSLFVCATFLFSSFAFSSSLLFLYALGTPPSTLWRNGSA